MSTVYINLESRVSLLTCLGECHSVKAYINIQPKKKKKTIFIGSLMSFIYFNPFSFFFFFGGKLPFIFYLNFHINFLLLPFHISPLLFPSCP